MCGVYSIHTIHIQVYTIGDATAELSNVIRLKGAKIQSVLRRSRRRPTWHPDLFYSVPCRPYMSTIMHDSTSHGSYW